MWTLGEKVSFIERCFGSGALSRDSINLSVRCPICDDPRPQKKKLVVRTDDDRCHCWVCGFKSRSLVPLLKKYCAPDRLIEYRSKFLKEGQFADRLAPGEEPPPPPLTLPKTFRLIATSLQHRDPDAFAAAHYLFNRGLNIDDFWYFKFGVAHDDSRYNNRVIFPSFDVDGRLNYITARAWDKSIGQRYANCDADRYAIVFNEINIDWSKSLNIVEGPFDLVKCPSNSVPLLGSELGEESELLNRIIVNETPVVLILDSEARDKSLRIARRLQSYNIKTKIADIGEHKDPGAMTKDLVVEAIGRAKVPDWEAFMRSKLMKLDRSRLSLWSRS